MCKTKKKKKKKRMRIKKENCRGKYIFNYYCEGCERRKYVWKKCEGTKKEYTVYIKEFIILLDITCIFYVHGFSVISSHAKKNNVFYISCFNCNHFHSKIVNNLWLFNIIIRSGIWNFNYISTKNYEFSFNIKVNTITAFSS